MGDQGSKGGLAHGAARKGARRWLGGPRLIEELSVQSCARHFTWTLCDELAGWIQEPLCTGSGEMGTTAEGTFLPALLCLLMAFERGRVDQHFCFARVVCRMHRCANGQLLPCSGTLGVTF